MASASISGASDARQPVRDRAVGNAHTDPNRATKERSTVIEWILISACCGPMSLDTIGSSYVTKSLRAHDRGALPPPSHGGCILPACDWRFLKSVESLAEPKN